MAFNLSAEIKRTREYLPIIGRAYWKLKKLREESRVLREEIRVLREETRNLTQDRQALAQQLDEAITQRARLLGHLQISSDAAFRSDAQSEIVRARFIELLQLIRPLGVADRSKIRVGGPHDGGYVMVDDFEYAVTAVSFGIGHEVSWDMDMATRGCRVFQFDHSVERPPVLDPRFIFHKKRLTANAALDGGITLSKLLELQELRDDDNIIMKMDIEGDEWDVLDTVSEACIKRMRQIVIEFHWLQNFACTEWADRAIRVATKLTQWHQPIHVHGNNTGGFAVLGGIPFPNVCEVTFIRKDHRVFIDSYQFWPTTLDAANKSDAADLNIGTFQFRQQV
jgi:hypothetical protein